jgi:SAM-dependent methyltransferase
MWHNKSTIRFIHLLARELLDLAQPKPDDVVLHVVAGNCGAVWLIAPEVGLAGKAVASAQALEWATVDSQTAHLPSFPFDDATFDIVLYSSSISRLADQLAGLRKWRRLLKSTGTIALCGYEENTFQPLANLFEACSRCYGVTPSTPSHSFARKPIIELEAMSDHLRAAGFGANDVRRTQLGYYLANPEEWWHVLGYSGALVRLDQLAPDALARFKIEHLAAVAQLATAGGIWLNVTAIFAVAQKK